MGLPIWHALRCAFHGAPFPRDAVHVARDFLFQGVCWISHGISDARFSHGAPHVTVAIRGTKYDMGFAMGSSYDNSN